MKRKDFLKASVATAGLSIVPEMLSAKAAAPRKSFRFAFISDIHVKPERIAEEGMARSLQNIRKLKPEAEFIVMGGDAIYDSLKASKEYTKTQWNLYQSILKNENTLPVFNCIGNHDIFGWFSRINLFKSKVQKMLNPSQYGREKSSYKKDIKQG